MRKVQICMFDGGSADCNWVRHMPGLKENLISWQTLEGIGYQYSSEGGVLDVSKGALVVLKGEMSRGLYRLIRNVQTGGAGGRTTTSDLSEGQVATRKRVTFVSSAKGCDNLSGSSQVKSSTFVLSR